MVTTGQLNPLIADYQLYTDFKGNSSLNEERLLGLRSAQTVLLDIGSLTSLSLYILQ